MRAIIAYLLLISFRDRLFHGMVLGMAALAYIATVLGHTALTEEAQTSITLAAGSIRLLMMVGIMALVSFHVHIARESRELDAQLARPIARHRVVFAYFCAFALIVSIMGLIAAAVLFILSPLSLSGFAAYIFSLIAEGMLVAAATMFAAFVLRSNVLSVMATMGFYALSRLMGLFMLTISNRPVGGDSAEVIAANLVHIVSMITPRLDFFAKSEWLHYGVSMQPVLLFSLQAAIFVPLLLCAVILDLKRKAF